MAGSITICFGEERSATPIIPKRLLFYFTPSYKTLLEEFKQMKWNMFKASVLFLLLLSATVIHGESSQETAMNVCMSVCVCVGSGRGSGGVSCCKAA